MHEHKQPAFSLVSGITLWDLTSFYIRSLDHLRIKNKKARNKPKKTRGKKKKKLQPGTVHKIVCLWSQLFYDEEEKNPTIYFTPGLKTSF